MHTDTLATTASPTVAAQPSGEVAALLEVLPAEDAPEIETDSSILGLVEILLKFPGRADQLNRDEALQAHLIPRFLAIALSSYALFAVAMLIILNAAPAEAYPRRLLTVPPASWHNGSGPGLLAAYLIGLVAASCICLPSFYFFALLAGAKMTMLQIVGVVVRGTATSALVLVGILPIYVAVILGLVIVHSPVELLEYGLYLGLVLPFVAGLAGVHAIYRGVTGMAETMPDACRSGRACFLRRLTVSWAVCYTAVSPVMIYRLWESLAGPWA